MRCGLERQGRHGCTLSVSRLCTMNEFNPLIDVEDSHLILDQGVWPNFHDAEIHRLTIWRGDVRPDDDVWVGPVVEVSLELCALKDPYTVTLKFHDCIDIQLQSFNHQNAVYDLRLQYQARGFLLDGSPMTPYIDVEFVEAYGARMGFKCYRIQAVK